MRAPQNIISQRIKDVVERLLDGESRASIIRFISENFDVGERQAENYLKMANDEIRNMVEKDMTRDYNKAVLRYEKIYNLLFRNNKFKDCISVNDRICQLQGLYKTQIEHSGNIEFISNIPE